MSSAANPAQISANCSYETFVHSPGTNAAAYLTKDSGTTHYWRSMVDYDSFAFSVCNAVLTGNGVTNVQIIAADDTAATNPIVVFDSGVLSGTAVGNGAFGEIVGVQVREVSAAAGTKAKYVTLKITVANSADVLAVSILRSKAKHPQLNLTPATF